MNMISVLFVCLGNICRSPTAEGFFQKAVIDENLEEKFLVDSAGTGSWHAGESPDKRAISTAKKRGVDISSIVARQIEDADIEKFDYILAMDKENLDNIHRLCNSAQKDKVFLFLDFAKNFSEQEVPDPYFGDSGGFGFVADLIEDAATGLLDHIRDIRND